MFDVTLSFDNGPEPDVTPFVLDVLARRSICTTFFMIGEKLARPEGRKLAERAHAEGHWIGNHTWTHSIPLGRRSEPDIAEIEIGRTQDLIGDLAHPSRYFRPFGGGGAIGEHLLNPAVVDYLIAGKFTCVLWNALPRDWVEPDHWVDRALTQATSTPGSLMVLHDLPNGAMRHLERFLDLLTERGGNIRQDFPTNYMPIVKGVVMQPIETYVARPHHAA